jgi:hypothetical protein
LPENDGSISASPAGNQRPGEWICLREFCLKIGIAACERKPKLFATWLPDPLAEDAFVVIFFLDDDSKWSMAAHYNRARLLGAGSANPG